MNYYLLYLSLLCNPDTVYSYDYKDVLQHLETVKQEAQQEKIHTKLDSIIIKLKSKENGTQ